MDTKRQVTLYLEPEQLEWLQALNRRTCVSNSVRIREAVELLREQVRLEQAREQSRHLPVWPAKSPTYPIGVVARGRPRRERAE